MEAYITIGIAFEKHGKIKHFVIKRLKHHRPLLPYDSRTTLKHTGRGNTVAAHPPPATRRPRGFGIKTIIALHIPFHLADCCSLRSPCRCGLSKITPINQPCKQMVNHGCRTPVAQHPYLFQIRQIAVKHSLIHTCIAPLVRGVAAPSPRAQGVDIQSCKRGHNSRTGSDSQRDITFPFSQRQ